MRLRHLFRLGKRPSPSARESTAFVRGKVLEGAPRPESPREFSFVMVWKDLDSLKSFVGDDYQSPHIDPAEAELVESRTITHYKLVE